MNAATAGHAGTPQLKQFHMVNIKTKFPRGIWIRSLAQEGATAHAKRAPGPGLKHQASSVKPQAPEASSDKPEAASSLIREPWNMDIGEVLGDKGPRVFIMIKELVGCFTWKAI